MKVLKFGGTSVGSAARIKHVAKLIAERGRNIVVLSAMSGTTNTLASIADYLYKGNIDGAKETALDLYDHYAATLSELFANEVGYDGAAEAIKQRFDAVHALCVAPFTVDKEKDLLAQGEMMSVAMMRAYLQAQGYRVGYLPALDIIALNDDSEPDTTRIGEALAPRLADADSFDLYLTEGFICRDARGRIDNLQRGGSDYTASLIGAAIGAEEIQIWTDIDGMHNNDPRYVEGTTPVNELHFEEAAELAYFGAKILHPTCVQPAKVNNIPVRLLNSLDPLSPGTIIHNCVTAEPGAKAIAAKDGITAIRIKSGRKHLAYGFLRKVFTVFETYRTPIDIITTSEVAVSVTVDSTRDLDRILGELRSFGTVTVDTDMVIVSIVGDMHWKHCHIHATIMQALSHIPVRMISYGGSDHNISLLIPQAYKVDALRALSAALF